MQDAAFNSPKLTPAKAVDLPDTHVKLASSVTPRSDRRPSKPCSNCTPHGNSSMCRCGVCKKTKDIRLFYYDRKRGHSNMCMDCKADRNAAYQRGLAKRMKKTVKKARTARKAKTIRKEVKRAARLTTTKSNTGLEAMLDVGMFLAKSDKRAWKKKLNDEISQAQEHIAKCRVALSLLDKI